MQGVCVSLFCTHVYVELQVFTGMGNCELGGSGHLWSQQLLRQDPVEV